MMFKTKDSIDAFAGYFIGNLSNIRQIVGTTLLKFHKPTLTTPISTLSGFTGEYTDQSPQSKYVHAYISPKYLKHARAYTSRQNYRLNISSGTSSVGNDLLKGTPLDTGYLRSSYRFNMYYTKNYITLIIRNTAKYAHETHEGVRDDGSTINFREPGTSSHYLKKHISASRVKRMLKSIKMQI